LSLVFDDRYRDARMKAGVEHRVPLSSRCIEILNQAKKLSPDSQYVFPGRPVTGHQTPSLSMVFLMALRRLDRTDLTAHGFRSTFRDWSEEQDNAPRSIAEAALAHRVRDKVKAAYRRSDLFDRRRELMNRWSEFATQKQQLVTQLTVKGIVGSPPCSSSSRAFTPV
jgi:integrase